jgi:hypothetical protein
VVYIKKIFSNANGDIVQLGGPIATDEMIADGWFEYNGDVPRADNYMLVNGVLQSYTPEIPRATQVQIYKEYLTNTDFKMLPGYTPKPNEDLPAILNQRDIARAYIRENDTKPIVVGPAPLANTSN